MLFCHYQPQDFLNEWKRNEQKKALITGITGQDGSYLAQFLLEKGYEVHGLRRRSSQFNTDRIDTLFKDRHDDNAKLFLHYGDLTDEGSLSRVIEKVKPFEIYNLAAQSHVGVSFENPVYTSEVNGIGALKMLEAARRIMDPSEFRFYQASTSELYGEVLERPQSETTPFNPRSPYGIAKQFAFWTIKNYREAYGLYACNGILFNHESPRRGENFVTRKITLGLNRIKYGLQKTLFLGNLDALRDWGHARDYVRMQWIMLQQPQAKDYVIATGKQYSIREFLSKCCSSMGIEISFEGFAENEKAIVSKLNPESQDYFKIGQVLVQVDPTFYRPTEVESLLGDASLAKRDLNWMNEITLDELIQDMMSSDQAKVKIEKLVSEQ